MHILTERHIKNNLSTNYNESNEKQRYNFGNISESILRKKCCLKTLFIKDINLNITNQ